MRIRPGFGEFPAFALLLGGWHVEQAGKIRRRAVRPMRFDGAALAICKRLSNRRWSSIRRRSCWMRSALPPALKSMATGLTRCTC